MRKPVKIIKRGTYSTKGSDVTSTVGTQRETEKELKLREKGSRVQKERNLSGKKDKNFVRGC